MFNHKEWYQKNREERLAYQKKYNKSHREDRSKYQEEWGKKNPDKINKSVKRYRKKNPHKKKVWDKAKNIKLQGMCQICHKRKSTDRHHPDYSKPREVILVCKQCHKDLHSQQYAELNSVDLLDEVKGSPQSADTPSESAPNQVQATEGTSLSKKIVDIKSLVNCVRRESRPIEGHGDIPSLNACWGFIIEDLDNLDKKFKEAIKRLKDEFTLFGKDLNWAHEKIDKIMGEDLVK